MRMASVPPPGNETFWSVRSLELAGQLRAAIMEGDDARIARLLSDLLRVKGLTKGQRVRLQLRALLNLLHSLRSAALNDEVTGLYNRRGFVQTGTRLLDLAVRDEQPAQLLYFRLEQVSLMKEAGAPSSGDLLARQMGNFLRDLFPSYGVYEVLGRLSGNEFAALTPVGEHAAQSAIRLRARNGETSALPLHLGIAHFNPLYPVAIDELLQSASQAADLFEDVPRMASSGLAPQPGMTLC